MGLQCRKIKVHNTYIFWGKDCTLERDFYYNAVTYKIEPL